MSTSIGYEHLKEIYYLKKAQAKSPLAASSAYILPLMAMQSACLAIEEYISQVGRKVDTAWDDFEWQDVSIREQLVYLFKKMGRPLQFNTGIWKEVLILFETTAMIQGNLSEMKKLYREEIPENIKDIAVKYPIYRSQAITEETADLLLDISDLSRVANKKVNFVK